MSIIKNMEQIRKSVEELNEMLPENQRYKFEYPSWYLEYVLNADVGALAGLEVAKEEEPDFSSWSQKDFEEWVSECLHDAR